MVDTGASVSLISRDVIKLLELPITSTKSIMIKTANGSESPTAGSLKINLFPYNHETNTISTWATSVLFHVFDELPVQALLGRDALKSCTINFSRNTLTVKHGSKEFTVPFIDQTKCFLTLPEEKDPAYKYQAEPHTRTTTKPSSIDINSSIPKALREQIQNIISQYHQCFEAPDDSDLPLFAHGNHKPLHLPLTSRVYTRPPSYHMAKAHLDKFQEQISKWLKAGVIRKQDRQVEFNSPILAVPKRSGELRFCIDARAINAIISQETIHLPRIQDALRKIANYQVYSTIDIDSFFLNFLLSRDSADLMTFTNQFDGQQYYFCRTPFGVRHSMRNSIKLLTEALQTIPNHDQFLLSYVDDLIIFSESYGEHIEHLRLVISKLAELNIRLKGSKAHIAYDEAEIFGYIVNSKGYTISAARRNSILKIPRPTSRKQLLKAIGSVSYFRTLLPCDRPMAYFVHQFRNLTSSKSKFTWNDEYEAIWDELKAAMHRHLTLQRLLDSDQHVIVRADSSDTYFGGTLSTVRDGKEILIFTMSKTWSPTATSYHISRKELFGLLILMAEFRNDLIGRESCIVETDNPRAFFVLQNPNKILVEGTLLPRLLHNIRFIQYTVRRASNSQSSWTLVDNLSRSGKKFIIRARNMNDLLQPIDDDLNENELILFSDTQARIYHIDDIPVASPLLNLRNLEKIKVDILNSPEYLQNHVIPEKYRQPLLDALHCTGHIGQVPMATILSNAGFCWKSRNREIWETVKRCETCGVYKTHNNRLVERQSTLNETRPKTTLSIDVSTIGQPSSFHFMVMVDNVTHYIVTQRIIGNLTSTNIARTLLILLSRYAPNARCIKLDNASYFASNTFQEFLKTLGLRLSFISRHNSRGNGLAERAIRSIQDQLRLMKIKNFSGPNIDLALQISEVIINSRPRHGRISPFMLTHGHALGYNPRILPPLPSIIDLDDHQKFLFLRIKDLNELLLTYQSNPTITPTIKLHRPGDYIRIKMGQPVGMTKITAPLFSETLYKIIDVNEDHLTYKIQNTVKTNEKPKIIHHRFTKLVLPSTQQSSLDTIKKSHNSLQKYTRDSDTITHPMRLRSAIRKTQQ